MPVTFPPPLLDDFNRANSALAGTVTSVGGYIWVTPLVTGQNDWTISSNQLAGSTGNEHSAYVQKAFSEDLGVALTMVTLPSVGGSAVVRLRLPPTASYPFDNSGTDEDYYMLLASVNAGALNDELNWNSVIDGATANVDGSTGFDWAAGDSFGATFEEVGGITHIDTWRKVGAGAWTSVGSFTDGTAGRSTVSGYAAVSHFFDSVVVVGNFLVTAPTTSPGDNPPIGVLGRGAGW